MQLLYESKTDRSLLKADFPEGFSLRANPKHYINQKETLRIIDPVYPGVFLSGHTQGGGQENVFDMKFGTVILCNVTKKKKKSGRKKFPNFQDCSYRDDDVTNYVDFFEKLCKKWPKYVFF